MSFISDSEARALNRHFRGRDYATNVLTFVYAERGALAGDIAICAPVVRREARAQKISLAAHYAHLTVHGVLHLQGYDHVRRREAEHMERLEARIIASRVPGIDARLLKQLVSFVQQLRALDLKKLPSVSETIDWAKVLVLMHTSVLEVAVVRETLNVLLKFEADIEAADKQLAGMTHKAQREAGIT